MAHVKLTPEVSDILGRSTIEGNTLRLPPAKLDRASYEKVNKAITTAGGKWKGGKVQAHIFPGDARAALGMALKTGVVIDKKKVRQAFYTPYDVAQLVVSLAGVEGHAVLEPSAGEGALVNACQMAGAKFVHAIEMEPSCEESLRRATEFVNITDFLSVKPKPAYNRVVMNPPFAKGQDVKHIEHALKFLAKGGRLVTIVPDKNNARLTALGAFIEEVMEAGTFKSSGTNVATRIISIRKD